MSNHVESDAATIAPLRASLEKWAAIAGRWTFAGSNAEYLGPEESRLPLGIALSAARIRNGTVSAKIRLTRTERTTAGIVFGYQSLNAPYVVAQLGAYNKAYAISEYRPGFGWISHATAGALSNLSTDKEYSEAIRKVLLA